MNLDQAAKALKNWETSYYEAAKAVHEVLSQKLHEAAGFKNVSEWIDSVLPGQFSRATAYNMSVWYQINRDRNPVDWTDIETAILLRKESDEKKRAALLAKADKAAVAAAKEAVMHKPGVKPDSVAKAASIARKAVVREGVKKPAPKAKATAATAPATSYTVEVTTDDDFGGKVRENLAGLIGKPVRKRGGKLTAKLDNLDAFFRFLRRDIESSDHEIELTLKVGKSSKL